MLQTRISGIPCQVNVTRCVTVAPDYSTWDSDIDYYGYSEVEYDVYDRKGYKAQWLANKITAADAERIEQEIVQSMQ